MIRCAAGTTNPTLLNRVGDWRDHEAWVDFVTRYDPVIRSNSGRYRLDAETTEELCQRVWIDLARRMRSYLYDPGMTFRGWLRRLYQSKAIDLLRGSGGFWASRCWASRCQPLFLVFGRSVVYRMVAKSRSESGDKISGRRKQGRDFGP